MITTDYLLLLTDRYVQVILQPDPGFQAFTDVLVIPTCHILRQIPYLENPVLFILPTASYDIEIGLLKPEIQLICLFGLRLYSVVTYCY